jgi:hypothetical protein
MERLMADKRKHPRVSAKLPVLLGPLSSAVVRDISRTGVRCVTPEPFSPMTVVGLRLELPTGREGDDAWVEVPCEGVVVRCRVLEKDGEGRYESAILFRNLGEDAERLLDEFVSGRINSPAG